MTKTELAKRLAEQTGLSQVKALEVISTIFDARPGKGIIAEELDAGGKVIIPGFGSFHTRHRSAREGRNPATGKKMRIPARSYPVFRPGKTLKERVGK